MNKTVLLLLLILMMGLLPARAKAAYPVLDGFSIYSSITVKISGTGINAVAVQPWDGKVVIGGKFTATGSGATLQNLARLNTDGTLDIAFNPAPNDAVGTIAIQSDQSGIYIGGSFSSVGALTRNGLARLDGGGTPDGFNPTTQTNTVVNAIVLQSGSILVGGRFTEMAGAPRNNIAGISSGGVLSAAFPVGTNGDVNAILLQDGMIVLGGSFTSPQPKLARFDVNGAFDGAFPAAPNDTVRSLTLQADGKILLGGDFTSITTNIGPQSRGYLARQNGDGTLDAFDPGANGYVTSIVLQPDGRILVGGNFTQIGLTARNHVARLYIDGTLDKDSDPHKDIDPNADAVVNAIALQPDGKFLVGGNFDKVGAGIKHRTRLARFYPNGALDEDVSSVGPTIVGLPLTLALQPNGMVTVAGTFTSILGNPRVDIAGLNPDWSLANQPNLPLHGPPIILTPQPDGKVIVGGNPVDAAVRLDSGGSPDPQFNVPAELSLNTVSMVLLRPGTLLPDGTPLENGMVYIGGAFGNGKTLARLKKDGTRDDSFNPPDSLSSPPLDGQVSTIVIQPDNKVVVGTNTGKIMRLGTDGTRDSSFTVLTLTDAVWALALQGDGEHILAFGKFTQNFLRIDKWGTVDNSFNVQTSGSITCVALQTDGSMLIGGQFDKVNGISRDDVARILPDGTLDPAFNLGTFSPSGMFVTNKVAFLKLQSDGKLIVAGAFTKMNNVGSKKALARFSNGWATQELSVSPDGRKVTWLRGGTGPELWRVSLEDSADGATWSYLGDAVRIPEGGGWYLDGLNLGAGGWNTNRYLRARGYVAGERGSSGSLMESVRLYYLKQGIPTVLTVTAVAKSKTYGMADPPLEFTASGFVNGDTSAILTGSLARGAGGDFGSYAINKGTLSAGANYTIAFTGANLTISQKTITVTANLQTKIYGNADPVLTFTYNPDLVGGDTFSGAVSRTAGETVGAYAINQGTLALNGNYILVYVGANFTIGKKNIIVTADAKGKTYGDADPPLTATNSGFLAGDLGNGKITISSARVVGENAGSYDITPMASDNGTGLLANYTGSYLHGTFTISKAPLTVTAEGKSRLRGAPNPVLTARFDVLAGFDTAASLGGVPSLTTAADASSPAGSYAIVAALGSITSTNYSFSFVDGILTVTGAAQQIISFDPMRPKTFGDGDFDPGATASSGLPVEYASSAPGIATVVGRKIRVLAPGITDITASQAGNGEYAPAADVVRSLTVNPPPWNGLGFDGIDDLVWIGNAPQLNFGSMASFSIETWLHLPDDPPPDGTGLVSKGNGGGAGGGYQLLLHQGRIAAEIGDGTLSLGVAEGLVGTSSLNDGQWHHVALSVDRASATASLYLDGRLEAKLSNPALGVMNLDNAERLQVGVDQSGTHFFKGEIDELRIWATARDINDIRRTVSQIVDPLDPKEPNLAAYFHFDEGDAGLNNASFTSAPERTANGANGVLRGFALSGDASNWVRSGAFLPLLETAPVSLVTTSAAASGGVVYPNYYPPTDRGVCWGTAPNPGLGDACSHQGAGVGAFATALTGLVPGASYHVRGFATNGMGTAYGNDLSFQTARLDLTVTADDKVRAFGAPNPPLTASYTGFVNGENPTLAGITGSPVLWTDATQASPVGSYDIYASPGSLTAPNYSFVTKKGTLTVAKKTLTVTADDKTRAFGAGNPTLTYHYAETEFVNGENPSNAGITGSPVLWTDAGQASPVRSYDINVSPGSLTAPNYSFVPKNGTLTVAKKTLTVTADDKTRAFGAGNPTLTYQYTEAEFANGENPTLAGITGSPVLRTDATQASPVGSYDIKVSLGTLVASNYSFIPKTGTLTVIKSCQEIVFPPIGDRTFGDPPLEIRASACSGLGITFASSDPRVAQINGTTLTITGAGVVVITASQGGTGDLDRAPDVAQTVVVHRSGQALGFTSLAGKVLGDPPFTLSATASSGLPVGYQSSEPTVAEVNGNTVTLKGAGTAVITARQPGNGNYNEALPISQPLTVASEGVAPLLALSTLPSGAVTANPVLNIMGTASDASGIASLTVNGADLTGRAALFSSAVPLGIGENNIEVTARDGAGNRTTETLSIALDAAAPVISLATPADNSVSSAPLFTASGAVTPESEVTMGVNGSALQILSVTDGAFTGSGYLEPGVNTIEVSAALSGRLSRVKRSVTLAPGKPSVAITVPVEDIRTEHESITLRGTVEGEWCSVALDVAGRSFSPAVQAGGFQQVIALDHTGEFPITASVTDTGGNSSVAQRNIIRVDRILGDLNGDGCVDIRDALAVLRISLGIDQATAGALAHGDVAPLVNGVPQPDGKIDVGDLLLLLRKVVGLVDF